MEENTNLNHEENKENKQEAAKKKKPAIVFRPQNGSNSATASAGGRSRGGYTQGGYTSGGYSSGYSGGYSSAGSKRNASASNSNGSTRSSVKPVADKKPAATVAHSTTTAASTVTAGTVEKKNSRTLKAAAPEVTVAETKKVTASTVANTAETKKVATAPVEEVKVADSASTPAAAETKAVEKKESAKAVETVAVTVKKEENKSSENTEKVETAKTVETNESQDKSKTEATATNAQTAQTNTKPVNNHNDRGTRFDRPQNKDGQNNNYQRRDGQNGNSQRRDGQNGNFQRRDGQNGNFQRRDGQNGGFQNRDGQNGGFQRRDGQNGGFQRRDGQNGGFQRRDGQNGGFQRRDGQNGGFQNKDGQNGYQNKDGQRSSNGGQRRDNQRGSMGGLDLTPLQTKNSGDSRKPKDFERKSTDKKKYDQPKKAENTKNLNKSFKNKKPEAPAPVEKKEDEIRTLTLPDRMTIKDLADQMKVQPAALIKSLFLKGEIVMINSEIDFDKAEEIALEFNCICEHEVKVDVIEELLKDVEDADDSMITRPPVVCVMGHVDHGKTSLLDAIRETNVTSREAGGITQHIGAYVVECNGQKITFLDTPGHEAFTAMRMRGAMSTDIAILVVAADDGVMPQTVEAINHAKAAGVEIIVAINKIDKPSANVEKVKQELTEYELIPEDWGGSTIFVPVSAHTKEGIDSLLEMILLAAEVHELKANPNRLARGLVIEAELDKGRGPVATMLVQKGTLHVGDSIAVGSCYGKVRAMIDDKGRRVKEALPSTPVEILGLNDVPMSGDIFVCHENEKEARAFAETFIKEHRVKLLDETKAKLTLDGLFSQIQAGKVKELNLIIKADVQGSVEAVKSSLVKLSNEEVIVKVIHGGVGAINESDVILASASNAIIIGFNIRPEPAAKITADREGVDMRLYRVIYQAIEDVEAAMKGMLDPVFEEKIIGHATVRQTFKASAIGTIAGSYVTDGIITRGCSVRITRDGEQIYEGPLGSLKRFKDDVKEVKEGFECGLAFEKFNDLKEDDVVEAYTMVEVAR